MIDSLRWLVALEVISLAFLPLGSWFLGRLPDRGYAATKVLGLVLVTYTTWLVGSVVPLAGSAVLPLLAVIAGAAGWWFWRSRMYARMYPVLRLIALEEAIFLGAFVAWAFLRTQVFGPSIAHTEQYMDMMILNASFHSAQYPPYDGWMSGHTVNYYYVGYLMWATVAKVSGVAPVVAYNLSLSTLFALTVTLAYSLGYWLVRHKLWAVAAPVFLALIGNWHALLWQIPHGLACSSPAVDTFWGTFWNSTRVVGGPFSLADWSCSSQPPAQIDYTINEYPLFSFVLGDLHPHVMALPVTLLAVAIAVSFLHRARPFALARDPSTLGWLVLTAICLGILFTINSWDFPTYVLVVVGAITVNAYLTGDPAGWWRAPLRSIPVLGLLSVVLFTPFYIHFRSLAHGIGLVVTRSDPYEFLQVFGLFLLSAGALVVTLGSLLQPVAEEEEEDVPEIPTREPAALERGAVRSSDASNLIFLGSLVVAAILATIFHFWVLLALCALGVYAVIVLARVLNTESPNRSDALALLLVGTACLVLALTEIIYLKDAFDGSASYRMNTVFKFYYQAWTLLALAGAYGLFRTWQVLGAYFSRVRARVVLVAVLLGTLGAAAYTIQVPNAAVQADGIYSLDGSAWVEIQHPGDAAAIRWLRSHAPQRAVELEAAGGEYTYGSRISVFTGLPTVMGWAGHEGQWRGDDPEIGTRTADVRTIYTTGSVRTAERLLHKYKVQYVVVGDQERQTYPGGKMLREFGRFMRVAFRQGSTTVYHW